MDTICYKKKSWFLLYIILLPYFLSNGQGAPDCEPLSPCACRLTGLNSSGVIDLSFLSRKSNSSSPRFDTVDIKNWHYSFSPCKPFNVFTKTDTKKRVTPCHDSVVARWTNIGSVPECMSLGDPGPASFKYTEETGTVTVTYKNETAKETRKAAIALVCNINMTANSSVFNLTHIDDPDNTYYFRLESPCCCPDGCPRMPVPTSRPGSTGQLSETEVIIIAVSLFLLLVIMAIVGFCIVKRHVSAHAVDNDLQKHLLA